MTDKSRAKWVMVVVLLQVLFFIGWYVKEADVYDRPATSIMIKTAPIDPRDFLSGQYVRMDYGINRIEDWRNKPAADGSRVKGAGDVWVLLKKTDGFYNDVYASPQKMKAGEDEIVVKGYGYGYSRVTYGIEKYFVPEGTPEPKRSQDVTAKIDVYANGKLRINQVYVDGKIWP